MKILPYVVGGFVLLVLAFALYVRSVPVKHPKFIPNATTFADLGQTPYDAVPPDAEETSAMSSSEQSSADAATIEL